MSDIGAAFIPEGVRVFFPNSTGMCNRIHGKSTEREGFGIVGGGGGKRYLEQVARGKSGEKGAFGPLGEPIGPGVESHLRVMRVMLGEMRRPSQHRNLGAGYF